MISHQMLSFSLAIRVEIWTLDYPRLSACQLSASARYLSPIFAAASLAAPENMLVCPGHRGLRRRWPSTVAMWYALDDSRYAVRKWAVCRRVDDPKSDCGQPNKVSPFYHLP
jgi:hypothetical protein